MKHLVLIIALVSFLVGGIAEMAHAEALDVSCAHVTQDGGHTDHDCAAESDQDHADFNSCQDCCCHHTHVMTKFLLNADAPLTVRTAVVLAPHEAPRSRTHSPLYRPPIA